MIGEKYGKLTVLEVDEEKVLNDVNIIYVNVNAVI